MMKVKSSPTYRFMYLTLWRSSTFSWYQLTEHAGSEMILHVNRAEWPSMASVEMGFITNLDGLTG